MPSDLQRLKRYHSPLLTTRTSQLRPTRRKVFITDPVQKHEIQPFVQTYKYDALYRLKEGKETRNGTQTWIQQFDYDLYGNRTGLYQNVGGQVINTTPAVDVNSNRFSSQSFHYDKNGNITQDTGPNSQNRTIVFNGDNKQTQVKDANNQPIGTYYYDGEGKRVKKVTDLETVVYVYSSGKLVAEYSTATPPSNPTISYTATDLLGSPRVLTNSLGVVVSRRDFMPFGEELFADGQNRTTNGNYSQTGEDSVRKRFTGYEKDMETGLDFAEARMYENRLGRFTAIDPLLASGKSANPQTFNRYIYGLNRPLALNDPTGLQSGKTAPPDRVNTQMFVDPSGRHFSTVQEKGYEKFSGSAYATSGGKNYLVTGSGAVAIGIPARDETCTSCIISKGSEVMALAKAIIRAAGTAATGYSEYQQIMKDPGVQVAMVMTVAGAPLVAEAELESMAAEDVSAETFFRTMSVESGKGLQESLNMSPEAKLLLQRLFRKLKSMTGSQWKLRSEPEQRRN